MVFKRRKRKLIQGIVKVYSDFFSNLIDYTLRLANRKVRIFEVVESENMHNERIIIVKGIKLRQKDCSALLYLIGEDGNLYGIYETSEIEIVE